MSLRLATQCLARWYAQTESDIEYMLRTVAYKSFTDYMIVEHEKLVSRDCELLTGRHKIKRRDFESYASYVAAAAKCLTIMVTDAHTGLAERHTPHFDLMQYTPHFDAAYQAKQHRVAEMRVLQALQLLMQPVLESCVLLDRLEYLRSDCLQHDELQSSKLCALFSQEMSPRNMALIACKKSAIQHDA
jgi:hypothetical protein